MQTALRKMGNSTGMIVPKALLDELGAATGTTMDVHVEDGKLIAMPKRAGVREGWAEAAAAIADEDDPELEDWLGFGVDGDDKLKW